MWEKHMWMNKKQRGEGGAHARVWLTHTHSSHLNPFRISSFEFLTVAASHASLYALQLIPFVSISIPPNNQATAATATKSVKRNKNKKLWLHAVRRFFKLSIDCNKSNKKIKTNLMLTFDIFNPIRFFLIRILEFKLLNFYAYS